MFDQQIIHLTNSKQALLKAIMHTLTEAALSQNIANTSTLASSTAGVLIMMPNTFQLSPTNFYNFGVHMSNVTATIIPVVFNDSTAQGIEQRIQTYAYENNGISVYPMAVNDLESKVKTKYASLTGEQLEQSFPHAMQMQAGSVVVTLMQEAITDDFIALTSYISYAVNSGMPNICTQGVGKVGDFLFQQNRFYESLSGVGFKLSGEVHTNFLIELQFTEPIMRSAKRDKAFKFNGALWGFVPTGLA